MSEIIGGIIIEVLKVVIYIPLHYIGSSFRWLIGGGKQSFKKVSENEMNYWWGIFIVGLTIIALVLIK